jgi:hypothetical protein
MVQFNEDVLFLILEELKHNKKSLFSCLLVNRTWCVIAVPILWRNPGQYSMTSISYNMLFDTIILHLSEESRDILKNQGMSNLITEKYQRPLFNYIDFWKYLELYLLESLISSRIIEKSNVPILRNEILKLFINKNAKFNHLSIPQNFDCQLHLIPGAEDCLLELESFCFHNNINLNVLRGVVKICKSIKKIEILDNFYLFGIPFSENESFNESLEESLIRHANTVQHLRVNWNFTTRFLSYFVNLLSLKIEMSYVKKPSNPRWNDPNYLKNLSLPFLKILKAHFVPVNILVNLIENTTENLSEMSIHCNNVVRYDGCKLLIQAIHQNCPNIRYLKLSLGRDFFDRNLLIPEFENLLINCQQLSGLIIKMCKGHEFSWDKFFLVLARSAPPGLFKFKFYSRTFELEDLKILFDNWKNENPILLKLKHSGAKMDRKLLYLFEQCKTKGVIKKYSFGFNGDFDWTYKSSIVYI